VAACAAALTPSSPSGYDVATLMPLCAEVEGLQPDRSKYEEARRDTLEESHGDPVIQRTLCNLGIGQADPQCGHGIQTILDSVMRTSSRCTE
jgi:hypothetical protein